jgi:hypothetical protein
VLKRRSDVSAPYTRRTPRAFEFRCRYWTTSPSDIWICDRSSNEKKNSGGLSSVAGVLAVLPMHRPQKPESRWLFGSISDSPVRAESFLNRPASFLGKNRVRRMRAVAPKKTGLCAEQPQRQRSRHWKSQAPQHPSPAKPARARLQKIGNTRKRNRHTWRCGNFISHICPQLPVATNQRGSPARREYALFNHRACVQTDLQNAGGPCRTERRYSASTCASQKPMPIPPYISCAALRCWRASSELPERR